MQEKSPADAGFFFDPDPIAMQMMEECMRTIRRSRDIRAGPMCAVALSSTALITRPTDAMGILASTDR